MTKKIWDTPEFREEFFGWRGRPVSGEAPSPISKNEMQLRSADYEPKLNYYFCNICRAEYFHENLQKTCEEIPTEELTTLAMGTVFKCDDDLLAILYDSSLQKQTHRRIYEIARTGIYPLSNVNEPWIMIPQLKVDARYLAHAKPVSEQEFAKVKETLESYLNYSSHHLPHVAKLEKFPSLIQFK